MTEDCSYSQIDDFTQLLFALEHAKERSIRVYRNGGSIRCTIHAEKNYRGDMEYDYFIEWWGNDSPQWVEICNSYHFFGRKLEDMDSIELEVFIFILKECDFDCGRVEVSILESDIERPSF